MEYVIGRLLDDFERGRVTRRELIQTLALTVTASSLGQTATAADDPLAKAISINHVSYQVTDYAKTRDFYADVFGMAVSNDDGTQCYLTFGDSLLVIRNRTPAPHVDHIAYTLANWDTDKNVRPAVEAALKRRGLEIRATEGSLHVQDPDGFDVQMGGKKQ